MSHTTQRAQYLEPTSFFAAHQNSSVTTLRRREPPSYSAVITGRLVIMAAYGGYGDMMMSGVGFEIVARLLLAGRAADNLRRSCGIHFPGQFGLYFGC